MTRYTLTDRSDGEVSFWLHDVRAVLFACSTVSVWLEGIQQPFFVPLPPDTARATYGQLMQAWAEAT